MTIRTAIKVLPDAPRVRANLLEAVQRDYESLAKAGPPDSLESYLLDRYGLSLETEYAGRALGNPWGKASGQLSMTARQVAEDVEAGLGFVVLKTVIAEDFSGTRAMDAWAVKASRMVAEPIAGRSGERGWTVTWKGRGWWESLDEYCDLIRESQSIARDRGTLIVPSCKYHLPGPGEQTWRIEEYQHTTRRIWDAWSQTAAHGTVLPLEKDFSPTLAGSDHASAKKQILEWLSTVPRLVRTAVDWGHTGSRIRVGLKLFNALFADEFQVEMLRAIHAPGAGRPDFFVYANRLFDPDREFDGHRGVAYGGPDLSDRNLRTVSMFHDAVRRDSKDVPRLPWSATGNICSGKLALEYALRGASSFQLHTFFQLPADQYRMKAGSKTQKALHELYFHPEHGFVVWMHHLAEVLGLHTEPLRFRDVIGIARDKRERFNNR